MGLARNFFRVGPRHAIQNFEWVSFNFFANSFNFQVLTRTAVQIARVTDSNCAKGGSIKRITVPEAGR